MSYYFFSPIQPDEVMPQPFSGIRSQFIQTYSTWVQAVTAAISDWHSILNTNYFQSSTIQARFEQHEAENLEKTEQAEIIPTAATFSQTLSTTSNHSEPTLMSNHTRQSSICQVKVPPSKIPELDSCECVCGCQFRLKTTLRAWMRQILDRPDKTPLNSKDRKNFLQAIRIQKSTLLCEHCETYCPPHQGEDEDR